MAQVPKAYFGQPKIYPNLNPAAAIPADRDQIFRLRNFADNYRMTKGKESCQYVPNSRFVFVTLTDGETLLHQRYRHPVLAEGKPVLYAGEANFNNGRLEWWSNGSGNYRPDADHALQAGLPMEHFFAFEDILKGIHTRSATSPMQGNTPHNRPSANPVQAKMAPRPGIPFHYRMQRLDY
jgi:hypothetical protein